MTINTVDSANLLKELYSYLILEVWCEECSTQDHPIVMNKIDGGLFYRCPICNKSIMVLAEIKSNIGSHHGTKCERCQELEKKYNITFGRKKQKG